MATNFHLPLTPTDKILQPPVFYLQVQDGLALTSGILWTIAYVLYVRQGFRDKSYGMPIVALCANFAWELLYGIYYSTSKAHFILHFPWVVTDLGLVYITLKFGPSEWKQSPLIANNLGLLLGIGITSIIAIYVAFTSIIPMKDARFWSAFIIQLFLSCASVVHLLSRNRVSGHSWAIWWCRWVGTLAAILLYFWRWHHYPETYASTRNPLTILLFVLIEAADLTYPFVYASLEKKKEKEN